jgi:hypothetical protein
MKKLLLLPLAIFAFEFVTHAQDEGYSWYFGTSPYNSIPAVTGSSGSYELTTLGAGSIVQLTNENVGLGASCGSPIDVGQITKPVGLLFSNSPQIISTTYSIEITINFSDDLTSRRLIGFSDLGGVDGDDGIYVDPTGQINFHSSAHGDNPVGSVSFNANTWYDLVFVRDGATKVISYYNDGILLGTYADTDDLFVPQAANSNAISFLKDDGAEESDGKIAKISIINRQLTPSEVIDELSNICNPSFQVAARDFNPQGYQWTFATTPLSSVAARDGSTGNYTLNTIGANSMTFGVSESVGLGTSCTSNIEVGQYPVDFGLEFSNNPQIVANTYTVEMVVKINNLNARLFGFTDLFGPEAGNSFLIDGAGLVKVWSTANGFETISPVPLVTNTWYHLVFARNNATKEIAFYQDGVLINTYSDPNDIFVPVLSNNNIITFLKDDDGDETDGEIAKIGVFNTALNATQVQDRFNNICNTDITVLPVSLKNFTATKEGKNVELNWTTSTEQNNLGFEIQRSTNGVDYTAIGFVTGAGNSTTEMKYRFTDESPVTGKSYYRLKQINSDNKFRLSAIRIIDFSKLSQDLQIYPNPVRLNLTVVNVKPGNTLNIFDSFGRFVGTRKAVNVEEIIPLNNLTSGMYILQVIDNSGAKRSIRFTKL